MKIAAASFILSHQMKSDYCTLGSGLILHEMMVLNGEGDSAKAIEQAKTNEIYTKKLEALKSTFTA